MTVLLFALLTLGVGGSLYFVRGQAGGSETNVVTADVSLASRGKQV